MACPAWGRASFQEFLAEGNLGTQPDPPVTEGAFMVQPLPPVTANGRPDNGLQRLGHQRLTAGKYDEFRTLLCKLLKPQADPQSNAGTPDMTPPRAGTPKNEMSLESESLPSLAPEDQPSLGRGGGEVAEWFSLINPTGGVEPPLAAPTPAAPGPGAAEVAALVERWVRRVALGGDQRRGAVRLDIGEGRYSGAELLVVAEAGHVSIELQLPDNLAEGDLSERLRSRLERRGYAADVVVR